jgi:hypothetical protein
MIAPPHGNNPIKNVHTVKYSLNKLNVFVALQAASVNNKMGNFQ